MSTPEFLSTNRRRIVAGLAIFAVAAISLIYAVPASGASTASSGDGSMTVNPSSATAGSTGNQFTFTFTGDDKKDFSNGSYVTLLIPAGWTAPNTTPGTPGYTTTTQGNCSAGSPTVTGTGPWTIQVPQQCPNDKSFTIVYGAVTASPTPGGATFNAASHNGSGGPATALRSGNPTVNVTVGPAAKLVFTQQPSGATGGIAFTTQPKVTVQDAGGNTVTGDSSTVSLSITSGTPTSGGPGTLSGCTQNETNGVITFSGCKIDTAGTGYKLHATDGTLTAADSTAFNVTVGPAAKLTFTSAPATGTAGSTLSTVTVAVQDAGGNTLAGSTDRIALTIASGPSGGIINSGTTTVTAVGGVAPFTGITFNTAGSYTLTATDVSQSLTTATSGSIVISAALPSTVTFVQGPSDAYVGTAMAPGVTVRVNDQYGNATPGITVTVAPSAGSIVAPGATASTDATGLATFGGITFNTTALGVTLSASTPNGASSGASAAFNVTVKVTTSAAGLTDSPAPADSGSGVKSVTYYHCAGWTGACTNGAQIGAPSTNPLNNYLVNWTSQPANGDYRVVAVSTDNVDNASSASDSIPVTVLN